MSIRPPQVVASAIVDKYIGESARVVREMFGYAKVRGPSVQLLGCVDTEIRPQNRGKERCWFVLLFPSGHLSCVMSKALNPQGGETVAATRTH